MKRRDILLLVDMGSLAKVESIIQEETNIKVKTIDMVSTPLILEAVRKTQFLKMDLDSTYSSLMNFKGYNLFFDNMDEGYIEKVIVTVCSTGDAVAVKLKELGIKYDLQYGSYTYKSDSHRHSKSRRKIKVI